MNILILEDDDKKYTNVFKELESVLDGEAFNANRVNYYDEFIFKIQEIKYDLIVFDIMVPLSRDEEGSPSNIIDKSLRFLKLPHSNNFKTPVIAITSYGELSDKEYQVLNQHDINVVKYNETGWDVAFHNKINSCKPKLSYDFVIVCALEKEASAYKYLGYSVSDTFNYNGLHCRKITIGDKSGVIVLLANMGLVQSAVSSTKAIEMFEPKLITMSGICAGISGKSNIYDIIIPDSCSQHDVGKWSDEGFSVDTYTRSLDHQIQTRIKAIIEQKDFKTQVAGSVSLTKSEYAKEEFDFDISLGILSSGNAVIANELVSKDIASQHRKKKAFEMEIYSLYEAAHQSVLKPIFFSAKSVVDDGTSGKSDNYQRVASNISAKTVALLIDFLI